MVGSLVPSGGSGVLLARLLRVFRVAYSFSDADFYQLDTSLPIIITVTLGELDDELKNIEK